VTVYLVDMNGDVYKSDTIVVQTDEGGKYIYNFAKVSFKRSNTIKQLLKALKILLEVIIISIWMYQRLTVPL